LRRGVADYEVWLNRVDAELLVSNRTDGRAIAQAISRRLSTATARVRSGIKLCGICGGESGTGVSFIRVLVSPANQYFH
jgi:hypothetical protein